MFNLICSTIENCFTKWLILKAIQDFIEMAIVLCLAIAFLIFMINLSKKLFND